MGIQFQPLKIEDSELFGIQLSGAVGRTDKGHLLDLADKCLAKGKLKVVLDISALKNLGGGGAAAFAEFQTRLVDAGGEAVFAGAQDVVAHFLQGKFKDLPLRFFPDMDSAVDGFFETAAKPAAAVAPEPGPPTKDLPEPPTPVSESGVPEAKATFCEEVPDPESLDETAVPEGVEEIASEVGAVGFCAEEFEIPEDEEDELEQDPGEKTKERNKNSSLKSGTARSGRRPEHSYTSLSDAISALGGWSASGGDHNFGTALENLLFSHGLAASSTLLAVHGDVFQDAEGKLQIPADGSLARQLTDRAQPLILLDIQDEDLCEQEVALLEKITPDIMLPVMPEGRLGAILLMKRTAEDEEYSVVEHFALELLMRVLSGEETGAASKVKTTAETAPTPANAEDGADAEDEDDSLSWAAFADDDTVSEVLLRLALDLPDADDRPHFWRIFARHLWSVLPMHTLAFLNPDKRRAQVVVGNNIALQGVNLGLNRLKVYFKTMERPVATANLPDFFREIRTALLDAGVDWLVSLRWEGQYQGTALFSLDRTYGRPEDETGKLVHELFSETSRMLARFDDGHENADVSLEVVALLMGQREKRMFGSDELTRATVAQLRRLARALGFPPDQERDLIHGCLLRDIGLMDKEDALMGDPEHLDPVQWSLYQRHTEDGARLLEQLNLSQSIIEVVRHHHERFSGQGFPQGLAGQEIPLTARVVTVVENYVAMVVGTENREPVLPQDAARILRDNLGSRYDPDIVNIFLRAVMSESDRVPVGL